MADISEHGPEQVIDAYRAELRRLHGDDFADRTELHYGKGWYYLNIAKCLPDGSVGVWGIASCYRKRQIIEMTDNLSNRDKGRCR